MTYRRKAMKPSQANGHVRRTPRRDVGDSRLVRKSRQARVERYLDRLDARDERRPDDLPDPWTTPTEETP